MTLRRKQDPLNPKSKVALDPCYYGDDINEKKRVAEILAKTDMNWKEELRKLENKVD